MLAHLRKIGSSIGFQENYKPISDFIRPGDFGSAATRRRFKSSDMSEHSKFNVAEKFQLRQTLQS
jgi:hypothetical protein